MPKNIHLKLIFFNIGGGQTFRIFLRSKWLLDLLDLPDLEIIMDFFNGKKYFFAKMLIFA